MIQTHSLVGLVFREGRDVIGVVEIANYFSGLPGCAVFLVSINVELP